MSEPTFLSLFAGIGGLDLGLERAGWRCVGQVERDPFCRRVLAKHWPDVPRWEDVRDVGAACLPRADLLCGGFPCQDISYAGRGAGLAGERSGLWFEFARLVRELEPRFVLVENVAALLTRGLDAVLGTLASLGYDAEWHCLPAAAVGAPHLRDRTFVLAYARCHGRQSDRTSRDVVGAAGAGQGERYQRERVWDTAGCGREVVPDTASQGCSQPWGPGSSLLGREALQPARLASLTGYPWVAEPDVGRVADGVPARVDRLRALGNAVVPQVAEFLGRCLLEAVAREGGAQ